MDPAPILHVVDGSFASDAAGQWCAEMASRSGARVIGLSLEPDAGLAAAGIAHAANEHQASMIVFGADDVGTWERRFGRNARLALLGSTAVPILSIPIGTIHPPDRVVVATDFRAESIRAAQTAIRIMGARGTIYLAHVQRPHEHIESALDQLNALALSLPSSPTLSVLPVMLSGETAHAIQHYAAEVHADLVAIGAHGQSRMAEFLWATMPMQLFRKPALPLVVVPAGAHAARSSQAGRTHAAHIGTTPTDRTVFADIASGEE